jgi:hypothetical protein
VFPLARESIRDRQCRDALRQVAADLPDVRGAALVQSSEAVRDLLRFWISNRAATVGLHAGMVAG